MFTSSTTISDYSNIMNPLVMEKATSKWKYNNVEIAPNCPRCASSNTKFCYYNNYSLSQPRYFCKGCRRYWTKGGSLRNVPVGGGCRKSRRSRAARQSGGPSYSDPALAGSAEASSGGACIDMAAVFAKYVDQRHVENVENEESFSPGASSGSSDNLQASTTFDVDSQLEDVTTFDMIGVGDDQMQQQVMMMPQLSTCQDFTGQQFVYQDSNGFGLGMQQQGVVLCDDVMWAEGTTLPNLGYQQPMVQVEDCGLFAADDDQLRMPANLVSENWGSFDLSAYDFYSTP